MLSKQFRVRRPAVEEVTVVVVVFAMFVQKLILVGGIGRAVAGVTGTVELDAKFIGG